MSTPDLSTALAEQGVPETIEVIGLLIQSEMGLQDGIVGIYNQRKKLRPATGFYIDVALIGSQPFGTSRGYEVDPASQDLVESNTVNMREVVQVDIFSYDASARLRKIDLLFALTSTSAQQLAEKYAFKISRIPSSFVDLSQVEASTRLNRFALTFNLLRSYGRTKPAETFTQFQNPPKTLLVNP